MDDEDEEFEFRELGQRGQQLAHVVLGHLPAQHGVADARVDAVRGAERQAVDVVAHQGNLAHEVKGAVEALDEQIRLEEKDVPREVHVFGRVAQR